MRLTRILLGDVLRTDATALAMGEHDRADHRDEQDQARPSKMNR